MTGPAQPPIPRRHGLALAIVPLSIAMAAGTATAAEDAHTELDPTGPQIERRNFVDEHIFSRIQRDGVRHAPLSSE